MARRIIVIIIITVIIIIIIIIMIIKVQRKPDAGSGLHPNHLQTQLSARPPPGGPPQRSAAMAQRMDSHSRTPGMRRRRNRLDKEEGADGTELPSPTRRASPTGRREKEMTAAKEASSGGEEAKADAVS